MKLIVFDFDYTLGDSTKGIEISINYALEQLGYAIKRTEEIKRTIGLSLTETFFALTNNKDIKAAELFAKYFKDKADKVMVENTVLYENVKTVLHDLRANGYKTAIVTTKFHYRIEQILNKYDADELIDVIVGAEDVKVEKPDPEGVLWAIRNSGVDKSEVLYVGDSLVDAKTAENAEVKFVAVLTGTTTENEFGNYNYECICNNILDVYNFVLKLK